MAVELEDGKVVKLPPLTIFQHEINLEVFLGDAENFELADDETVDTTEAFAAFEAMKAKIASQRKALEGAYRFLRKIEGAGYGGMADFEIARQQCREHCSDSD
jgi:hypothetical protein